MLPLADYERITRAIKSVLDSEDAATAHCCQFFALMGSAILFTHYQIAARPMFGAAFVLLDETSRDTLTYGTRTVMTPTATQTIIMPGSRRGSSWQDDADIRRYRQIGGFYSVQKWFM